MNRFMSVYDLLVDHPGQLDNTSTLTATQVPEADHLFPEHAAEKKRVGSIYTYSPKSTSINVGSLHYRCQQIMTCHFCQFPWPKEVTGLERIALSAKGDLQRMLRYVASFPVLIVH